VSISGNDIVALLGNDPMPASVNASVTIVPGSSSPSNSKFFVPNLLNVSAGTTVTWTNGDLTSYKSFEVEQLHTVTSGTLESRAIGIEFDSGFLGAGNIFQHTFNSSGTFDYFCTIHPFMTGKVIVSS
jgi:plastocyanin